MDRGRILWLFSDMVESFTQVERIVMFCLSRSPQERTSPLIADLQPNLKGIIYTYFSLISLDLGWRLDTKMVWKLPQQTGSGDKFKLRIAQRPCN